MVYKKNFKALVTKGPSKMDLVTALAYAYDKARGPFSVVFNLDNEEHNLPIPTKKVRGYPAKTDFGVTVAAKITKLEYEDGSGESFIMKGSLAYNDYTTSQARFDTPFEGYYSTKTRNGWIEFSLSMIDEK